MPEPAVPRYVLELGLFLFLKCLVLADRDPDAACFRNQLVELAKDPVANFVVQRLLVYVGLVRVQPLPMPADLCDVVCFGRHLGDAVQQRMAVGELMEHTESILASGCTGVVARMAQTCTPHEGLQKEFVQQLLKAFHVTEPQMRKTGACAGVGLQCTYRGGC